MLVLPNPFEGSQLAEVRMALGHTQLQFARIVGVHRRTISHWENSLALNNPRVAELINKELDKRRETSPILGFLAAHIKLTGIAKDSIENLQFLDQVRDFNADRRKTRLPYGVVVRELSLFGIKSANGRFEGIRFDPELNPEIPPPKPAAIEPTWEDGRLSLQTALGIDDPSSIADAFNALKSELDSLVEDCQTASNVDERFCNFAKKISGAIPDGVPTQSQLFQFAHWEAFFEAYAPVVSREWPEILAARYQSIKLLFLQTVNQHPKWKEFKRTAELRVMADNQKASAFRIVTSFVGFLRGNTTMQYVEPAVPDTLESLSHSSPSLTAMDDANELLAADLLESVNNILKTLSRAALMVASSATETAGDAGVAFGSTFRKSFVEWWAKRGGIDGPRFARVVYSIIVSAPVLALTVAFPTEFAWLSGIPELITRLIAL